jgi:RNA polymerase sigma factor (sigma-70 family)
VLLVKRFLLPDLFHAMGERFQDQFVLDLRVGYKQGLKEVRKRADLGETPKPGHQAFEMVKQVVEYDVLGEQGIGNLHGHSEADHHPEYASRQFILPPAPYTLPRGPGRAFGPGREAFDFQAALSHPAGSRRADMSAGSHLRHAGWFETTHWSVVLGSGHRDASRAREAMDRLCRAYWYPLYAYARRVGQKPEDAEDLVQSFFCRCVEHPFLDGADPCKGRFRSFLLVVFKRFLANEWEKARAGKRGGGQRFLALDALAPEQRYALEPVELATPELLFERRWALTLLERVLARLEDEQSATGNGPVFQLLKPYLTAAGGSSSYVELGHKAGLSEGAVKVAIHRLRRRYRVLLEDEIAQTVDTPAAIADERRHLLSRIAAT